MENITQRLKQLPDKPGVYLYKDDLGNIIYVGKALSLRSRVRQYFQSSRYMDAKVKALVSNIADLEIITTGTEMEALILENNLIKQHLPKYNVLLRDDKTYPYIKVTTGDPYPRILKTRVIAKDGSRYFGPFTDVGAVNSMVELINRVYRLKRCSPTWFHKNFSPCLHYHIHQCDGMCIGRGDPLEYSKRIDSAVSFLKGKNNDIIKHLTEKMQEASDAMQYEEAALFRDFLSAARVIHEKQRVVLKDLRDIDVVLFSASGGVVVFYVREGKLLGRDSFDLETAMEEGPPDVISAFIKQHYGSQGTGPSELLVSDLPEEAPLLATYLSGLWNRKVHIFRPVKGEKKALLDLAASDVLQMTAWSSERERGRENKARTTRQELLGLLERMGWEGTDTGKDLRVEAYDLSNIAGDFSVGGMVVFRDHRPDKKAYRKFRIRTVQGPDDYASMQEVLYRRLRRGIAKDPGFLPMPDLILLDGGGTHVSESWKVLEALGLAIPLAGMAKDDRHRTRSLFYQKGSGMVEESLKERPTLYRYLGTIQEEVHRFSVGYHRTLRDGHNIGSVLDGIQGVGPARRNALLGAFGSIDKIKEADVGELMQVPGISPAVAAKIREFFH